MSLKQKYKQLDHACKNGDLNTVKLLAENPEVDLTYQQNRPIRWACANNHMGVVKFLLKYRDVDPSDHNHYCVRYAIKYGFINMVKLLLCEPRVGYYTDDSHLGGLIYDELSRLKFAKRLSRYSEIGAVKYIMREVEKKKYANLWDNTVLF